MTDDEVDHDDRRALYAEVAAQESRYRDREWTNVVLFTGAMVAAISLAFERSNLAAFLVVIAALLAACCIYFTTYVHRALARVRTEKAGLENEMKLKKFLLREPCDSENTNWRRGLLNHLALWFTAQVALASFGAWHLVGARAGLLVPVCLLLLWLLVTIRQWPRK